MSAKRNQLQHYSDAYFSEALSSFPNYVYAGLDSAPLIVDFDHQLAQQREVDSLLRQIGAVIEFELACLTRGIDPRERGRG